MEPTTYPDVEFDDTPHDKHGRVSVAVLDPVDLEIAEHGAERGEEAQQKDDDETDFLARVHLELEQHGDRDNGDNHIGDDRDDGVRRKRRPGRETLALHQRVPRPLHLHVVPCKQCAPQSHSRPIFTYRSASQDQSQSTAQVSGHDGNHGSPDDPSVNDVVCPFKQPLVADQQRHLEEADAQLVDWPAGIVGARIRDQIRFRTQRQRQTQAVFRFWIGAAGRLDTRGTGL